MTVTHNDNESIIGRAEINDIDAILAIPVHDPNEVEHVDLGDDDSARLFIRNHILPTFHVSSASSGVNS